MEKKIGWIVLSGLITGPIMGSSIILMPPLIISTAGDWALPAWAIMIGISFLFAFIFSFMTLISPGEAGVANAIEKAFGSDIKFLASIYLIGAVLFGAPPVIFLIEKYLNFFGINQLLFYLGLLLLNLTILLRQLTSIGKLSLIFSTITAITLFSGSIITLSGYSEPMSTPQNFDLQSFGYALLLLFWIVVGWETMGSFSGEVKDPKRDIKKAAIFSAILIAIVELSVAASVQLADLNAIGMAVRDTETIIRPLFGKNSIYMLGFLTFGLCTASYISFVGSTSRLTSSLASIGKLPSVLSVKNKNGAPRNALLMFTIFHTMVLSGIYYKITDMETILAVADIFFIGNASIGILASAKLLKQRYLKVISSLMAVMFCSLLFFFYKSIPILLLVAAAALYGRKLRARPQSPVL